MVAIEEHFLNRPALERDEFASLYERLLAEVDRQMLSFLPMISFIMLKPDAYLRGLIPEIVDQLVATEIYPVRYEVTTLTETLIDRLYMFVKEKYFDTWWVMKKAYTLAPSVPMLVIGRKGEHEHLSARLRELVGPTTPLAGKETQIRYRFKATHRVFNLIHGTDDPAAAVRESLVFFEMSDVKHALKSAAAISEKDSRAAQELSYSTDLVPETKLDLRYSNVRLQAKQMALAFLVDQIPSQSSESDMIQLVNRLQDSYKEEQFIVMQKLSLREERDGLCKVFRDQQILLALLRDTIRDRIAQISERESPSLHRASAHNKLHSALGAIEFLNVLADEVEFRYKAFNQLLAQLADLGVLLDPYNEIILHVGWATASQEFRDIVLMA